MLDDQVRVRESMMHLAWHTFMVSTRLLSQKSDVHQQWIANRALTYILVAITMRWNSRMLLPTTIIHCQCNDRNSVVELEAAQSQMSSV